MASRRFGLVLHLGTREGELPALFLSLSRGPDPMTNRPTEGWTLHVRLLRWAWTWPIPRWPRTNVPPTHQRDDTPTERLTTEALRRVQDVLCGPSRLSLSRALLVAEIGEEAVLSLEGGGTYTVPSQTHPGRDYEVPREGYIQVLEHDRQIDSLCIVPEGELPWPDVVLARIKMLQANESVLYERGQRPIGAAPGAFRPVFLGNSMYPPGARMPEPFATGPLIREDRCREQGSHTIGLVSASPFSSRVWQCEDCGIVWITRNAGHPRGLCAPGSHSWLPLPTGHVCLQCGGMYER